MINLLYDLAIWFWGLILHSWAVVIGSWSLGIYNLIITEANCGEHVSIIKHVQESTTPTFSYICLLLGMVVAIYKVYDEIKKHHFTKDKKEN